MVISTVHSAKGLEWPVVHLPHLVDGAFPSDMALRDRRPGWKRSGASSTWPSPGPVTSSRCTPRCACPTTATAADDRHSLAPGQPVPDDEVLGTLDVEELTSARPPAPASVGRAVVGVDLDDLWR